MNKLRRSLWFCLLEDGIDAPHTWSMISSHARLHLLLQLPFCVVVIFFQGGCCNLLGVLQAFLVDAMTVLSSQLVQRGA